MNASQVLSRIRCDLDLHVGKPIRLRAHKGRKRVIEQEGILEGTYLNVFVVRFDFQGKRPFATRVSYSYSDLLTRTVEVSVLEHGEDRCLQFAVAR